MKTKKRKSNDPIFTIEDVLRANQRLIKNNGKPMKIENADSLLEIPKVTAEDINKSWKKFHERKDSMHD